MKWMMPIIGVAAMANVAVAMQAEVTLPCLFQDHMVLQRAANVPVWGKGEPGEQVTVSLDKQKASALVGSDGTWSAQLDLQSETGGPYRLVIHAKNEVTLSDVLVGEVWLASGQSNMEFALQDSDHGKEEVAHSANPLLREFKVAKIGSALPLDTCKGRWVAAGPDTAAQFSAVGYYFAKVLQFQLHVPVALVSSYYGGSGIEAWMSPSAIDSIPSLQAVAGPIMEETQTYPQRLHQYQQAYLAWQQQYHREDQPASEHEKRSEFATSTKDWHSIQLKGSYSDASLSAGGVLWIRRKIRIKPELAGIYLPLHLGAFGEFDEVYWNGVKVGSTTAMATTQITDQARSTTTRRYDVPSNLVKEGVVSVAIRIFNPVSAPSVADMPAMNAFDPPQGPEWEAKVESAEPPIAPEAVASFPHQPAFPAAERTIPSDLYNAMIHPLLPYAIRGVIWYQGEANVDHAVQYRTEFPAMIKDWRKQWGEGDFPFYFCQLANYQGKDSVPRESALAELREAQSMALSLPNTGQAITIDVGEESDIHFRDKRTVGLRLSRIALAKVYGKTLPYSGPVYVSSLREGSSMRVRFADTDGGLVAQPVPKEFKRKSTQTVTVPLTRNSPDSQLEGFQICGPDHKWMWANARIDGESVVISASAVKDPVAVRYGWGNNPTVNLYNGAGLPATPFRTDDFPSLTRDKHF